MYQNLWLKTVFSGLTASPPTGVSEVELQHLQQWSTAHAQHRQQQQNIQNYLSARLPATLHQMLEPDHLGALLQNFIEKYKRIDPQHSHRLEQDLLQFLADSGAESNAHFSELCRYEAALRALCFYQLPTALPAQQGPCLARWARVVYLGPFFPLVIAALKQGALADVSFAKWSTRPQVPYLLLQEFKGARLVKITPWVADCLELCDGSREWEAIVEDVIQQYPTLSLQTERETLRRAEAHYLQEGILLRSAAFFELG